MLEGDGRHTDRVFVRVQLHGIQQPVLLLHLLFRFPEHVGRDLRNASIYDPIDIHRTPPIEHP